MYKKMFTYQTTLGLWKQYKLPSHKEEQAHLRKCSEKKYKTSARIKGFAIWKATRGTQPTLEYRRQRFDMIILYKMLNNTFVPHETRRNPYKIVKPRANKTVRLNSFSHRVINNWNNLASEIVCAESVTIFKTRLDKSWISKRFNTSDIYWKTKTLKIVNTRTLRIWRKRGEQKAIYRA